MYERRYGSKAHETADVRPQEIAKLIRADIKAAKATGDLPADLNVSVRFRWATHSAAIDVEIRDRPDLWERCPGYRIAPGDSVGVGCGAYGCPDTYTHDRLTAEGQRIVAVVEAIHGAYNYDGSDSMVDYFDVRYYGQVSVEDAWGAKFRASEKARLAARKAAREARRSATV
jgi:hypothetical protein